VIAGDRLFGFPPPLPQEQPQAIHMDLDPHIFATWGAKWSVREEKVNCGVQTNHSANSDDSFCFMKANYKVRENHYLHENNAY